MLLFLERMIERRLRIEHSYKTEGILFMDKELISVVIPVYNVANYLEKCLNSVQRQTYEKLEIILVDDGSTDNSGEICDRYKEKDTRVQVFHKENGGLSDARNFGISKAKGRYITFIDSDDYVMPNYVKHLFDLISKYNADISVTCAIKFFEGREQPTEVAYEKIKSKLYTSEEALEDVLYRRNIPIYAWAKMYKTALFDNIKFPFGELFEDLSTEYLLFDRAEKIAFNPVRDYCYLQRKNSIINSNYDPRKMIQVYTCEKIISFIKKNYPSITRAAISKCFITTLNLYKNIPSKQDYKEDRKFVRSILIKYRKEVFKDKNNKFLTRIIAGISIINIRFVCIIGKLYQILVQNSILKLRNPI